jgi:chromosome segregation ATPase
MSQASGTGSGDDLQATMEAILQRLDKLDTIEERIGALEAKLPELQPLQDQVTLLEETVTEQGEQQRTLHAAIDRVEREQGRQHQELHAAIDRVTAAQRNISRDVPPMAARSTPRSSYRPAPASALLLTVVGPATS